MGSVEVLGRGSARRSWWAALVLAVSVCAAGPARAGGPEPRGRLEGLVLGVDGRAAEGYTVHLIDARGQAVARSAPAAAGVYAFNGVPAGTYALGVEDRLGVMAPVAAPPVRVVGDGLARRDIKLMQATAQTQAAVARGSYSLGVWWAGLSTGARVGVVLGGVAIIGVTAATLADDDEIDASPVQ